MKVERVSPDTPKPHEATRGSVHCRCANRPDLAYADTGQRMTQHQWDTIGPTGSFDCVNRDCGETHPCTKDICRFVPDGTAAGDVA